MKQKFIDCMMKFSHDAWGGDSIPSTEKSFAEVFDVLVKAGFIQEWQPIETAPKDGTQFYIDCPDLESGCTIVYFEKEILKSAFNGKPIGLHVTKPTHWQPLPPPPKTGV